MKNKVQLGLVSAVLIFSILACSFGKNDATEVPAVDTPLAVLPGGGDVMEILSTSSFIDQNGSYYVVGEVINNSDVSVTSVGLEIQLTDASGASLLRDDAGAVINSALFYTILFTIAPGESTPFSYYYDTTNGTPANYVVTVASYDNTETNRGQLESQNVQIVQDEYGEFILTGEVVNLSNQWVHIWGLAGGVLDDANTVLSADWTGTYTAILAPTGNEDRRDRSPFSISFSVPQIEATQWSLWWDAEIVTDFTDYSLAVGVTNSYFDEFGAAHLVGVVTNNSDTSLNSLVVAGLYGEDGTTLDASYAFLPLPVQPGAELPFDISYFGNVNYSADQAALVSTYSVQFDPWSTYPPSLESVALTPAGESIQRDASSWTVTGNFTNTTTQNLSGVSVLVAVYDSTGTLVATGYTFIYPSGDNFAPSTGDVYEVIIYFAPGIDTTGYTTQTLVVGDIGE